MIQQLRVLALLVALVAVAGDALAFQAELGRYFRALNDICRTGVTPDIVRVYEEAATAVEKAKYGGGRDNNFWGVKTPENAWLSCFQSPGDFP